MPIFKDKNLGLAICVGIVSVLLFISIVVAIMMITIPNDGNSFEGNCRIRLSNNYEHNVEFELTTTVDGQTYILDEGFMDYESWTDVYVTLPSGINDITFTTYRYGAGHTEYGFINSDSVTIIVSGGYNYDTSLSA